MVEEVLLKGKKIEGELIYCLIFFCNINHCVCKDKSLAVFYTHCLDFCLSCGNGNVEIFHPLFEGSLCLKCKVTHCDFFFPVRLLCSWAQVLIYAFFDVSVCACVCVCVCAHMLLAFIGEFYRDFIQI